MYALPAQSPSDRAIGPSAVEMNTVLPPTDTPAASANIPSRRPAGATEVPVGVAYLVPVKDVRPDHHVSVANRTAPQRAAMLGIATGSGRSFGAQPDLGAFVVVPEHDVDRAADRMPAVQGGGAVVQYLDALDRRDRQGVEIDGGRRSGGRTSVDEQRHAPGAENERPGKTKAVVALPSPHEIPDVDRTRQLEVLAADHRDRSNRTDLGGGDVAVHPSLGFGRGASRRQCRWRCDNQKGQDRPDRSAQAASAPRGTWRVRSPGELHQ